MAKNNFLVFAGALLFVLLLSYGITFTEERLLKADYNVNQSPAARNHAGNVMISGRKANLNRDILEGDVPKAASSANDTTAFDVDDFRPTNPGHSPGAGHSTGPASNDNN